jgi:hypothetical protein
MKIMIDQRRTAAIVLIVTMLAALALPAEVVSAGTPADDLKQIEYRYYFRGKYQQAIEALQTYLARVDLTEADTTRAREFLAASYVLGGAPAMGKEVFAQIIAARPSYAGPDPTVFKLDVVNAYAQAKSEYAALALQNPPVTAGQGATAPTESAAASPTPGKPIYKKWWFYAGAAVALIAVGAAASGTDGGAGTTSPTGTVDVGVIVR